jgi:hypothetical protein
VQAQPKSSEFSSVVGLGAFMSEHVPSSVQRITNLLLSAGAILAAPLLCGLAAWIAYDAYNRSGLNRVDDSGAILPLICGVVLLPLGAWGAFSAIRNWALGVALYEGGFALKDRQGIKQVRWNDIESVWQDVTNHYRYGIKVSTTYLYTIQTADKTKIKLDNKYPKIGDLGKAISIGATNALLPKYIASINSGQRVTFGPLALDRAGMYLGNKALTWQEIKAVKIAQGIISVKKEGGWFNWATVTVPQIPNFFVFYDLVSRFTKIE